MRTALFLALCCVLFTLSMSDDEEAKKKNETETDAEDDDDDDDDDEDDDEDDYEDSADNDTFIDIEEDNVLCRTCRLVVAGIEKGVRKAEHFKKVRRSRFERWSYERFPSRGKPTPRSVLCWLELAELNI